MLLAAAAADDDDDDDDDDEGINFGNPKWRKKGGGRGKGLPHSQHSVVISRQKMAQKLSECNRKVSTTY